ncbi:MAG: NUDIX hydrolase [Deltaproteobacteria bacterium]|nr:NUDIX hydrolase [Nannocystaceae bacterium]
MVAHRGVGVIVTDPARSRFVVQRKDASYPRYPRGHSLFGGACEPGESSEATLERELFEELGDASARVLLDAGPREIGAFTVGESGFTFVLFEAVVAVEMLDVLAARPVHEGERAEIITREELPGLAWVWGLEAVLAAYIAGIGPRE